MVLGSCRTQTTRPSTEFTIEENGDVVALRPPDPFPRTTLDEVVACLPSQVKPKALAKWIPR